jgi:hypothetical protein
VKELEMSLATLNVNLWVVLDDQGSVVLIAGGADAPGVAEEWAARGYRVECVDATEVGEA